MDWNETSQIVCTTGETKGDIILMKEVEMGMKLRGIFSGERNIRLYNWPWAKVGEGVQDHPKKA